MASKSVTLLPHCYSQHYQNVCLRELQPTRDAKHSTMTGQHATCVHWHKEMYDRCSQQLVENEWFLAKVTHQVANHSYEVVTVVGRTHQRNCYHLRLMNERFKDINISDSDQVSNVPCVSPTSVSTSHQLPGEDGMATLGIILLRRRVCLHQVVAIHPSKVM